MAKKTRNPSQSTTQQPNHQQSSNPANDRSNPTLAQNINQVLKVQDKKHARRDAKQIGLNKADLPNSIKEVIATLVEAGYEGYIVGGGVRDALLSLRPKDFDAVTNATPSQIKEVFGKRCRIIGRRFQLCHVYSGRDMIEVATFRAPPKDDSFTTDEGMLTRDNVWGDIYQDAVRRDFSINALYYQPLEGFVYDFCGGLEDVQSKTLRLLGDAQKRVEEDPVRLLRALRFKAKLGFRFSTDLEKQFNSENWALIAHVSPHRLYDESQKMFTGGYLVPLLPLLFDYRAIEHLIFYPPTRLMPLVERVASNTDKRINEGKSINPAFFYAAILWENYLFLLDKFKKNMPFAEAQHHAANKVMDKQRTLTAMPKFAEQFIKDVWLMQPRLAEPRRKNIQKLFENPRFRAGFDFLHLREMVQGQQHGSDTASAQTLDTESTNSMGDWWAWFQTLGIKQQQQAIAEFDLEKTKQRFGKTTKNPTKNAKKSVQKSRLSQQEQGEKDQLRQLSLATKQPSQSPKPLWETPTQIGDNRPRFMLDEQDEGGFLDSTNELEDVSDVQNGGYDVENFDAPRQSRRERRIANQALRQITNADIATDATHPTPTEKPRTTTAKPSVSRLVEQTVPTHRKRREPSSTMSVLERKHLGIEKTINTVTQNTVAKIPNNETVESNAAVKKPHRRKAQTPVTETKSLPEKTAKIPAIRSRKKVVGTETVKSLENVQTTQTLEKFNSINGDVTQNTATEQAVAKPPVKRGRKPKAVLENTVIKNMATENVEVLPVKAENVSKKIPAKRTRKKPSE